MHLVISTSFVILISMITYIGIGRLSQTEKCLEISKNFTYWPIVLNMWNKRDNLRTMKDVLDRLGYQMVDGEKEEW